MTQASNRFGRTAVLLLVSSLLPLVSIAQDYAWSRDDAAARQAAFVDHMVTTHRFDRAALQALLETIEIRQSALNAISRPAERVVPWYEYRQIFLNDARIDAGARFWQEHADLVAEMSERYGVAPEILLAILGIESLFGERMGTYRVIDALGTLAFAYPPRADFFASELEALLLISRDESPAVLDGLGSYAGAMGAGQFIPSSYRAYAVDADGDGFRDLWGNWEDILASIANYLAEHRWHAGEPVAVPAEQGTAPGMEPANRLALDKTVGALRAEGYVFDASLPDDWPAMLVALERDEASTGYWIGLHNFYVITRYNRSNKYALAAVELGEAIAERYRQLNSGAQSLLAQ